MRDADVRVRTEEALGRGVERMFALSGGCVGEVYRATLEDGTSVVVKVDGGETPALSVEGWMLAYLAEHSELPVPRVMHAVDDLLVMEHVESSGSGGGEAELHAAELLAALHGIDAGRGFGLERDTLIGGLHQPNGWSASWVEFYGQRRLVELARQAEGAGRISSRLRGRVEKLASTLDRVIEEPREASLVHGDVWSGNVLVRGGRVAAFIDPAIYYADAEVELAFIDWLHCFGRGFFARYDEIRGIREGFWEERRTAYQLYPQLVHARLFGGGYVGEVERGLGALGA
jgi:fructosamine-3-kinase